MIKANSTYFHPICVTCPGIIIWDFKTKKDFVSFEIQKIGMLEDKTGKLKETASPVLKRKKLSDSQVNGAFQFTEVCQ